MDGVVVFGLGRCTRRSPFWPRCRGRLGNAIYFSLQCALVTGIVLLSPIRGLLNILLLPVLSQAIFDLSKRYATLVGFIYLA